MNVYIYADIFMIFNIVLNGIILLFTALLAGVNYKLWRILFAAALGSIYALGSLLNDYSVLYTPWAKLLASLIIVLSAFPIRSVRSLAVIVSGFYIVSFLLGGAVFGWLFFFQPAIFGHAGGITWLSLSWKQVAAGVTIAGLLILISFRRFTASMTKRRMLFPLIISYDNRRARLTALLDTGNHLFTVTGHKPVILVEELALAPILSDLAITYLQENNPAAWFANLDSCQDQTWLSRIEIIPYRSVGISHMLLGFRPDGLKILANSGEIDSPAVVIAIYSGRLTADDNYQALLHPAVMQCVNEGGTGRCA